MLILQFLFISGGYSTSLCKHDIFRRLLSDFGGFRRSQICAKPHSRVDQALTRAFNDHDTKGGKPTDAGAASQTQQLVKGVSRRAALDRL